MAQESDGSPKEPQQGLVIRMLGPFSVCRDGAPLPPDVWGRRKTQLLLKLLLTRRGRLFHQDELIEALYPEASPETMLRNLLGRISELRKALEPGLVRGGESAYIRRVSSGTYCFSDRADCWIDAEAFLVHVEAARASEVRGNPAEASARYRQAVNLYQGDYLEEEPYTEWVVTVREQWRERFLDALEGLARCEEQLGRYQEAAVQSGRIIETDPYRESAYCRKMRCHYRDGQPSQAEQTYQACRRALADLGVDPSAETQALYADIVARRLSPPSRANRHNLPARLTPCLGRGQERAEIRRLLTGAECRLLTLLGPGGIGKSRLAVEAAADLLPQFDDGVWFVSLAPVNDPEALASAITAALPMGMPTGEEPKRRLLNFLREKAMLLLLDNLEQLAPAVDLLTEILTTAPRVRLLVTSRIRLRLEGEWALEVDGLRVPEPGTTEPAEQFSGVQLFVQTVRRRNSRFALTPAVEPHVVRICRLLDGFPLGIELAASWAAILSCEEIAAEIERTNDARALPREAPAETRPSLRATIERSYQWLSPDEGAAWERLSIFRGGFDREAARQVVGASPSVLAHLIDKSLLRSDQPGRFDMHEVLRQYAVQRRQEGSESGEWELHRRYSRYYAALLHARGPALRGAGQEQALAELEADRENLSAAWRWALTNGQTEELSQALDGMAEFLLRSHRQQEGLRLFGEGLERVRAMAEARGHGESLEVLAARMTARHGFLAFRLGDYPLARERLSAGLAAAQSLGLRREQAICLRGLAGVAHRTGLFREAAVLGEQFLALTREEDAPADLVDGLIRLSSLQIAFGDLEAAGLTCQEALATSQRTGLDIDAARALHNLAVIAVRRKEYPRARALFQEVLTIYLAKGAQLHASRVLGNLGTVAYREGKMEESRHFYQEELRYARACGDRSLFADALVQLGGLCGDLGEAEAARGHLSKALPLCLEIGATPLALEAIYSLALLYRRAGEPDLAAQMLALILHHPGGEQQTRDRARQMLDELTQSLPPEVLAEARARGAGLDLDAVASALTVGAR